MQATALLRRVATLFCVLAVVACGKKTVIMSPLPGTSVAPGMILEQFLDAANAKDLPKMGNLFGTKDGPVIKRDDPKLVEQQMFIFANVLKHDDYKIEGETIIPGRQQEAIVLNVQLTMGQRKVVVPFTMVRTKANSWMVEEFGILKITNYR